MLLQLLNIGLKSSLGILAPLIFGIFILERNLHFWLQIVPSHHKISTLMNVI